MATKTQNKSRGDLASRTAARIAENYRNNPEKSAGGEVEDGIHHSETHEAADNDTAEEIIQNIYEDATVEAEKDTIETGGEEADIGVTLQDSPLPGSEQFKPVIDTDFSPHQGEVASTVTYNPADLIFGIDRPRRIRDRNLPEDYSSYEIGLKKEMMFSDVQGPHSLQDFVKGEASAGESHRRPKPRYSAFVENDGDTFHAMGAPAASQTNVGTPVGSDLSADEFFFEFFNGGDKASVPELSPAVSSLFNADPIFSKQSNDYEIEVEAGRDLIYDLFVSESDAVSRKEAEERWGDVLEEALPTNQNYGRIDDFTEIEGVEDFVEIVASRPAKLAPEISPDQIKLGDEFGAETLAELQASRGVDEQEQWALFDQNRQEMDLETLEQERKYEGKVFVDGELVEATIDHRGLEQDEFDELMDGYFDIQNSMVRPDVAPKVNGVVEFRDFTHSDRTYQAVLTQRAFMQKYGEVQEVFAEAGVDSETAEEFREEVVYQGLDAEMPDYTTGFGSEASLREFYRFELLPVLEEGVREAFSDETPYVVQKLAEHEEYDDFEDDVLSEFDDLSEFLEYQDLMDEVDYRAEGYGEESEAFVDWFVETAYREEMEHWLDPDTPTVNEKIRDEANIHGPDAAVDMKERASMSSYEVMN